MRIIRTTALFALTSLALVGACNKDKDEPSNATPKATSAGPIVMTAAAFHAEYTSLTGAEVMKKYMNRKVIINGPVLRTMDMGEYGGFQVWLETSGKHHVAVKFSDDGAAARTKRLAKGAQLKVRCDIAGVMGKNIHLIDCDLQS